MILGKGSPSSYDRNWRRALIIRRHRLMLEAELRRLRMFPEDDEPQDDEERSAP